MNIASMNGNNGGGGHHHHHQYHGFLGRVAEVLRHYFQMDERGTTVQREVRAGMVTFLISSYALLVNPQILAQIGYSAQQVVISTAIASAVASIVCGLLSNLPVCLAPHLGLSAYLASGLVLAGLLTRQQAMTSCLLAGIIQGLSALLGLNEILLMVIPHSVKLATVVGMGLLLSLIGMFATDVVVPNADTLVTLGDLTDYKIWLALGGTVFTGTLLFHQVKSGILLGIVLMTIVVLLVDHHEHTTSLKPPHPLPYSILNNVSFTDWSPHMISATFAFFFSVLFEVSGVMNGMASLARLMDREGHVPGSKWAFIGSSVGTIVGAMGGCAPIVVEVESAAGIQEGGRTGLTGVVTGVLFLCSLVLTPLLAMIPNVATAPVLIIMGTIMMGEAKLIDWSDMSQAIPAFLTSMIIPFTFSIPNGILFGLGFSAFFFVSTGHFLPFLKRPVRPGQAPTETTSLQDDGKAMVKRPSLFDDQALVRRPSLLLPKSTVDQIEVEVVGTPMGTRRPRRSTDGGGHVATVYV